MPSRESRTHVLKFLARTLAVISVCFKVHLNLFAVLFVDCFV